MTLNPIPGSTLHNMIVEDLPRRAGFRVCIGGFTYKIPIQLTLFRCGAIARVKEKGYSNFLTVGFS
jgi:hypothetical protein